MLSPARLIAASTLLLLLHAGDGASAAGSSQPPGCCAVETIQATILKEPRATSAAGRAPLAVPPINYDHRILANGLEVYTIRDHSSPTVAIQVWYRVGSKHDPEKRSGFAHLFEHVMFKGTKNMPDEMMDRLTEDIGGMNNATTRDDATQYYEVVPSNYLETLLWAEGERMASLNVNEANFKSERDVVKEEFRYRVLSPPYGRLFYAIDRYSFVKHPYRRPGIGSIEDLDAAVLADVQDFHRTFYRPDNAILIVAGDFDRAQLDGWIDRYLGAIARPAVPIVRLDAKEPPRTTTRRIAERGPSVPLPAVLMTWLIPAASHADSPALTVAAAVLSLGESSRLYQSLVYRQKIAQEAQADADLREDAGLFIALAVMATGHAPKAGEKALLAEIAAMATKPVGSAEMTKARNQIIASVLRERETNNGKASDLGNAIVLFRDAAAVNRAVERVQAVTASDVQRVVTKYLTTGKPVIISYTSEAEKKPDSVVSCQLSGEPPSPPGRSVGAHSSASATPMVGRKP